MAPQPVHGASHGAQAANHRLPGTRMRPRLVPDHGQFGVVQAVRALRARLSGRQRASAQRNRHDMLDGQSAGVGLAGMHGLVVSPNLRPTVGSQEL